MRLSSWLSLTLAASSLPACASSSGDANSSDVIFGVDNRTEVFEQSDVAVREIAERSVVGIFSSNVKRRRNGWFGLGGETVSIDASTLGSQENLCDGERFFDQPKASDCTGTLIADDLVLTAGHCVDTQNGQFTVEEACARMTMAFGYYYDAPGVRHPLSGDYLFTCKEVVVRRDDSDEGVHDYAVIRLDRDATPRFQAAAIAQNAPRAQTSVLTIGTPSGIPIKVAAGASVLNARSGESDYFTANIDAYQGSSGSPVLDASKKSVVGVLVRGPKDGTESYVERNGCFIASTCPQSGCNGQGISVSKVSDAIADLCTKLSGHSLCSR
jgi:V8-like Glu-specific endopeptidase